MDCNLISLAIHNRLLNCIYVTVPTMTGKGKSKHISSVASSIGWMPRMITPPTIFFNNSYEYKHLPTRQLWLNLSVHFTSIPFGICINCALWLWPVVHCSAHIEQLIYTALNIEWWASTHMFCGYIERDIPYHVRSKFALAVCIVVT